MSKVWVKYCMYDAYDAGHKDHPQTEIYKVYPDADSFVPESIADAWFFKATPFEGEQPFCFYLAPQYGQPSTGEYVLWTLI